MSPFGVSRTWLHQGELVYLARLGSVFLYPHSVCQEACAVYTMAIERAIVRGAGVSQFDGDILAWAEQSRRKKGVCEAVRLAVTEPSDDFPTHHWALVALENAFCT